MLTVEEALARVLDAAAPLGPEEVPLVTSLGRALARDIVASVDLPPFDRSAMDGFALRASDTKEEGAVLRVVGEVRAGDAGDLRLEPGETIRIMTGAPLPPGADAVQMVELTESAGGENQVRIVRSVVKGENVRFRGADLAAGTPVLRAGTEVRSAEIGLLASLGIVDVPVHRLPRVAVLSTGDEVVEPGDAALPHQIRNSNAPVLVSMLAGLGVEADYLGIARDERAALSGAIRRGLSADVLCLTGGVSVGEYDLVGETLRAEGAEVVFHRVAVKPGKPILFARRGETLVFGLPGNPVSTFCGFTLFVAPALRRLSGFAGESAPSMEGTLETELRQRPGREWYCLARADWREGGWRVSPVPSTGSGDVMAATRANCFAIVPAQVDRLPAGARVRLLPWRDAL